MQQMNAEEHDNPLEEYTDVLSGLDRLRRRIDAARYPGPTWQAPPARRGWPLGLAAGVSAAAAAVVLTFGVQWMLNFSDGDPTTLPVVLRQPPTALAPQPGEPVELMRVPSEHVDAALGSTVELTVPQVSMITAESFGGVEFRVPSISFSWQGERSSTDETQDNLDPAGHSRRDDVGGVGDLRTS